MSDRPEEKRTRREKRPVRFWGRIFLLAVFVVAAHLFFLLFLEHHYASELKAFAACESGAAEDGSESSGVLACASEHIPAWVIVLSLALGLLTGLSLFTMLFIVIMAFLRIIFGQWIDFVKEGPAGPPR